MNKIEFEEYGKIVSRLDELLIEINKIQRVLEGAKTNKIELESLEKIENKLTKLTKEFEELNLRAKKLQEN